MCSGVQGPHPAVPVWPCESGASVLVVVWPCESDASVLVVHWRLRAFSGVGMELMSLFQPSELSSGLLRTDSGAFPGVSKETIKCYQTGVFCVVDDMQDAMSPSQAFWAMGWMAWPSDGYKHGSCYLISGQADVTNKNFENSCTSAGMWPRPLSFLEAPEKILGLQRSRRGKILTYAGTPRQVLP